VEISASGLRLLLTRSPKVSHGYANCNCDNCTSRLCSDATHFDRETGGYAVSRCDEKRLTAVSLSPTVDHLDRDWKRDGKFAISLLSMSTSGHKAVARLSDHWIRIRL
ncbi:hypothetical protein PRIPAC_91817, partial [Pristionchus pacificus]|uniref:Uncharacterized protein n=1 Tax=Pristionchus pacificus TaxID=54126 RepID=A0A2A6CDF4_PRIPA